MELSQLEIRIARTPSLPLLSSAASEIMGMADYNTNIREYECIILRDPALAANILRAANSAYYGGNGSLTNLSQAIARLGINTVRSICITAAFHSSLNGKRLHKLFDSQSFWQHSLAVACSCKVLSVMVHYHDPELAFIAGLLHDIGKPALYMFLPLQMNLVHETVQSENLTQFQAEYSIMQFTHQECGRLVAGRWQLPVVYHEAIGNHHDPMSCRHKPDMLALLVHVGNALAHRAGITCILGEADAGFDEAVVAELDLDIEQFDALARIIAAEVAKLSFQE
jgi:putative nucleotidyltransferase with HDIG domain